VRALEIIGEAANYELLQCQIAATDQDTDALVYELYALSDDEIKSVEGAVPLFNP